MARPVVTQEFVDTAADMLLSEGTTPTVILVQEQTGGSYTTVKRYLDRWREAKKTVLVPAIEIPEEVVTKSNELTRALWSLVTVYAEQRIADVQQTAQAEIAAARGTVQELERAITRQEERNEEQGERLLSLEADLRQAHTDRERAQAAMQIVEARITELVERQREDRQQIERTQAQLQQAEDQRVQADELRQTALDRTHGAERALSHTTGQLAAAQQQIEHQQQLIDRLTDQLVRRDNPVSEE